MAILTVNNKNLKYFLNEVPNSRSFLSIVTIVLRIYCNNQSIFTKFTFKVVVLYVSVFNIVDYASCQSKHKILQVNDLIFKYTHKFSFFFYQLSQMYK